MKINETIVAELLLGGVSKNIRHLECVIRGISLEQRHSTIAISANFSIINEWSKRNDGTILFPQLTTQKHFVVLNKSTLEVMPIHPTSTLLHKVLAERFGQTNEANAS